MPNASQLRGALVNTPSQLPSLFYINIPFYRITLAGRQEEWMRRQVIRMGRTDAHSETLGSWASCGATIGGKGDKTRQGKCSLLGWAPKRLVS